MSDKSDLSDYKEEFATCVDAEDENRQAALDDLKFARLGEQWPDAIQNARRLDARPYLTINKMPAFIRQVVNDARQNKPQINVRPVDSLADVDTAEVYNGLIRNIETSSNADIAYDTAAEFAVSMGWGFIRIDIDYPYDDSFEKELFIRRVANPFCVYGDPYSSEADSSDWNISFVTDLMPLEQFEARYKGAEKVDWDGTYSKMDAPWREGEEILVAERWKRTEVPGKLFKLSSGEIVDEETWNDNKDLFETNLIRIVNERPTKKHKVEHCIMTGAETLEKTIWPGKYIPIIPVYGEELNVEGKRYFRSLIRDAKDAQRMHNYWRTTTTEVVALSPRVPFVGEEGAFDVDTEKWDTINTRNWGYVEHKRGTQRPQREPFQGTPAGALQEALNASDDMKAIMGMYDASLGMRSNETSGKAIMARQREGDISTYHFIDNLSRGIRHTGKVLIDLIPHIYSGERIVRILGQDGQAKAVPINQPVMEQPGPDGEKNAQPMPPEAMQQMKAANPGFQPKVYDIGRGKYDLVVEAGPSFTTRREETSQMIMELLRAFPQAAPYVADILVENLDIPGGKKITERMKALIPGQQGPQQDPKLMEALQKLQAQVQQLSGENAQLKMQLQAAKGDKTVDMLGLGIDKFQAETDRMKTQADVAATMQSIHQRAVFPPTPGNGSAI